MKKGDLFQISVRRFYTSDEAPVISPESTALVRVTDPDKCAESCGNLIRNIVEKLGTATAELPFRNMRQMTEAEAHTLLDYEDADDSVEGMTRQ